MAQSTLSVRSWRVDLPDRLWRLVISVRIALILIGLIALCTFIGTLVPQSANAGLYDAVAYQNWLEFQRMRFGAFSSLVTLFDAAGVFNIFQSWYFRLLLVLLTTSIVLGGIVNRIPRIWRGAMHLPPVVVGERLFDVHESARRVDGGGDHERATVALVGALRARRYRVVTEETGDRTFVYAHKNRYGIFGTFVSHVGLVLLLAGALIGNIFGWRDDVFTITDGSTRELGRGTNLALRNALFVDQYDPATGLPSDFYTDAVLLERQGDQWVERQQHRIRVNDPLAYGGVVMHQAFFGPAAVLSVKDNQGNVMFNDGVALPWRNPDGRPLGWVDIPAGRFPIPLSIFVIGRVPGGRFSDPAIKPGQIAVEVYPSGRSSPDTLLYRGLLDVGTPAAMLAPNGRPILELTFERERQFTGLNLSYNPGLPLIWTACIMMLLGWGAVFYFPHRRVRALVAPALAGGTRVASVVISKLDLGARGEQERLMAEVGERLSGDRGPGLRDREGIGQPDVVMRDA